MSSSSPTELLAPAKLNLFLEVLGRRPDGYHEIDSVFAALDLADTVRVAPAPSLSLTVEGRAAPADRTNLAWRAAEALGVPARIHLVKRIPAGAGLGGGSSDAAAVLRALGGHLPPERLREVAAGLGADVPFFLTGGTARCRGIGERVEPVPGAPRRRFLLLLPEIAMTTAEVYAAVSAAGLTGNRQNASVFLRRYSGKEGPGRTRYFNRLQGAAEGLDGRLREVRERAESLYGAAFTMSGSGSAYFAEFTGDVRPREFTAAGVRVEALEVNTC